MSLQQVIKRDGRQTPYAVLRIRNAIFLASNDEELADRLAATVDKRLHDLNEEVLDVETIQDMVESVLHSEGLNSLAHSYHEYRTERSRAREAKSTLMQAITDLTFTAAVERTDQRENANVDADAPMGSMLKYGTTASKQWALNTLIPKQFAEDHISGKIHIHDLDFYALTTTCTQISLKKLFEHGFFTGHGYVREPNGIGAAAALACIAIQANQNDQHGGQSIPNFEYDLAPYVAKTFRTELARVMECSGYGTHTIEHCCVVLNKRIKAGDSVLDLNASEVFGILDFKPSHTPFTRILKLAYKYTEKAVYQAMEALIHNLNTMSSRAGAQVPFSSINYGTGTSPEQRMIIKQCLLALNAGLGNGETSIFPIHVFKTKKGVNFNEGDPNYDLFELACEVSARRLFPNFTFLDAPYNLEYYKKGDPDTEVATMGCRTRVMANVNGPATTSGRGNLSFTTINLPRLGIESHGDYDAFLKAVKETAEEVVQQLLARYEVQANRHVYNYPFLMEQHVAMGSDNLSREDTVREAVKHGTLTLGFIGLAEAMVAVFGKHHGEDDEIAKKAYDTIKLIRQIADEATAKYHLNFSVIATPAEGLSGRFVRIDKERYGVIKGVTDREYYTNSFHVPVYYPCSAFHKIDVEGPFHALCNGGHITYVELDGDITKNVQAFMTVIRYMGEKGVGYGSVNHPVDRCPVCGFTGVINDECPRCGVHEGQELPLDEAHEIYQKYNH